MQGWSRKKKEALINGMPEELPKLAIAYRDKWGLREPQPPKVPEPQPHNDGADVKGPGNSDGEKSSIDT